MTVTCRTNFSGRSLYPKCRFTTDDTDYCYDPDDDSRDYPDMELEYVGDNWEDSGDYFLGLCEGGMCNLCVCARERERAVALCCRN